MLNPQEYVSPLLMTFDQSGLTVRLWREHHQFHVCAHNGHLLSWKTYRTLNDARRMFRFLVGHLTSEQV